MTNKEIEAEKESLPLPEGLADIDDVIDALNFGDLAGANISGYVIHKMKPYLVGATFMRIKQSLAEDGVVYIKKSVEKELRQVIQAYLRRTGVHGEYIVFEG